MTAARYAVHGLPVGSDLPLPLAAAAGHGDPDLVLRRSGDAAVPDRPPAGASRGTLGAPPDRVWWTLDGDAYRVRFAGACDLTIGPPWRTVDVRVDPAAAEEVVADRIISTAVPFALERLGHELLHAAAVESGGRTVAFVGPSGSGKSTLVALLCADGATLVSDDQLRVELEPDGVVCHPGLGLIRLRSDASAVAALLDERARATWDGRTATSPGVLASGPLRIAALALPWIDDEAREPAVDRLSAAQALPLLSSSRPTPRSLAWQRERFDLHAGLLERLPVFRVRLPRGRLPERAARVALLERLAGG
ncbi:MAG TPA: hypothetical protein VGW10_09180 [Solirubrobacteraceae bacterium]|nr:hypothetical protein [Solirubrobacteraceae bacterium]